MNQDKLIWKLREAGLGFEAARAAVILMQHPRGAEGCVQQEVGEIGLDALERIEWEEPPVPTKVLRATWKAKKVDVKAKIKELRDAQEKR